MDTMQVIQHALEAPQERSGCQHHWVLDSPAGPVSKGACRSCGEERDFPNYIETPYNTWDRAYQRELPPELPGAEVARIYKVSPKTW